MRQKQEQANKWQMDLLVQYDPEKAQKFVIEYRKDDKEKDENDFAPMDVEEFRQTDPYFAPKIKDEDEEEFDAEIWRRPEYMGRPDLKR